MTPTHPRFCLESGHNRQKHITQNRPRSPSTWIIPGCSEHVLCATDATRHWQVDKWASHFYLHYYTLFSSPWIFFCFTRPHQFALPSVGGVLLSHFVFARARRSYRRRPFATIHTSKSPPPVDSRPRSLRGGRPECGGSLGSCGRGSCPRLSRRTQEHHPI
jgi:hypothetical protein